MSNRESLPNRRGNVSFNFLHDNRQYHATATRYADGRLAEIFLDVGRAGSSVQQHAEATAVLASLALQYGVAPRTIIHAVSGGPLAAAMELSLMPEPTGKKLTFDESLDRATAIVAAKFPPRDLEGK